MCMCALILNSCSKNNLFNFTNAFCRHLHFTQNSNQLIRWKLPIKTSILSFCKVGIPQFYCPNIFNYYIKIIFIKFLDDLIYCCLIYFKGLCENIEGGFRSRLLCLSEIFHHVCNVTTHVSPDLGNITMVVLLHIATKFKDTISNEKRLTQLSERSEKTSVVGVSGKMVIDLENRLCRVVTLLPVDGEERDMLIKKLSE